jgi:hypothetical protein
VTSSRTTWALRDHTPSGLCASSRRVSGPTDFRLRNRRRGAAPDPGTADRGGLASRTLDLQLRDYRLWLDDFPQSSFPVPPQRRPAHGPPADAFGRPLEPETASSAVHNRQFFGSRAELRRLARRPRPRVTADARSPTSPGLPAAELRGPVIGATRAARGDDRRLVPERDRRRLAGQPRQPVFEAALNGADAALNAFLGGRRST